MQHAPLRTRLIDSLSMISRDWHDWFNSITKIPYVDRGDPSVVDYTSATLTKDGAWNDLDLSSIIGTGLKLVHIRMTAQATVGGLTMSLRKKGNSNSSNTSAIATQVSNIIKVQDAMQPCDKNGVIQYLLTSSMNWTDAGTTLTIRGWQNL